MDDAVVSTSYADDIDDQNTGNYTYDAIGNMTQDAAEQIANITWTVYGKIKKVTRTAPSTKPDLEFIYDAGGNRICKIVKPKPLSVATYKYSYYLRDAQGNELKRSAHECQ